MRSPLCSIDRCNPICEQLGCTPFARGPGFSSATIPVEKRLSSPGRGLDENDWDSAPVGRQPLLIRAASSIGQSTSTHILGRSEQAKHAPIHHALALQHARSVRSGEEVLAPGVFTSPAIGLFHLSTAAELGHVPSMLALACLHLHIRPRKVCGRSKAVTTLPSPP